MKKVGKDGVITVEESKTMETVLETVEEHAVRSRLHLSPYFVTDPERMEVTLEDPAHPDPREKKSSNMKGPAAAARADGTRRPSAADHR